MTPESNKSLLTNCPQKCQIMDVTKCFATFIVTPKIVYVTQHSPSPKCSHILQSDMKETVVNESATGVFEKKCPICKESQWKVNQKQQPLIPCTIESCEDSMNMITNSDDQKLVYEYWNIDVPAKEVSYHHKCRLKFTYQVSKSKSQDTAILDDTYTNTFSYIYIHWSTCHWLISTRIHYHFYYFPSGEVSELLHLQRYR